jgi:hypothetical protein
VVDKHTILSVTLPADGKAAHAAFHGVARTTTSTERTAPDTINRYIVGTNRIM